MAPIQPERRTDKLALALSCALGILAGTTGMSVAQGVVRSVHADWQIRCDTPPGAQGEQCALIQSVTAEDRANVGLTVIVLKTADNKIAADAHRRPDGRAAAVGPRPQDRQ